MAFFVKKIEMMCHQIMQTSTYGKTVELPALAGTEQAEVPPPCPCIHTGQCLHSPAYILDMPVLEAHIFLLLGIE